MLNYKALPFAPALERLVPAIGQSNVPAGVSPSIMKAVPIAADVVHAALFGAGSYVGIWTGQKATGFVSVLGWGVGILSGLGGIGALINLVRNDTASAAVSTSSASRTRGASFRHPSGRTSWPMLKR